MNDRPGVSRELRLRVLEAAKELGFSPNLAARSLATTRTQTIGFMIRSFNQPFSSDLFYFPMVTALEQELVAHDYHILLNTSGGEDDLKLRMLQQNRVDGLILAGPNLNKQLVITVCHSGIPAIIIDNKPEHTKANTILTDDFGGAIEATNHLIKHGYKSIAHIGGPLDWTSSKQRFAGYLASMEAAGLGGESRAIHKNATNVATGLAAALEILKNPNPPRAIFAGNDVMAIGASQAAASLGLSIPGDLALVGFDNISWAEHSNPPLTTVRIFKEQMGRMAARRILELIEDQEAVPVETVVSTQMVIRNSCGCP